MMIKVLRLTFIVFFLFFPSGAVDAFDWIAVHEKAQILSLSSDPVQLRSGALTPEEIYLSGLMALRRHEYALAQDIFEDLAKRNPNLPEVYWGIAETLRFSHRYDESMDLLHKVIKKRKAFAPAYLSLAYIYYIQRDFKQSARYTARVFELGRESMDINSLTQAHGLYAAAKGMEAQFASPLVRGMNFFAVKRHLALARSLQPDSFTVAFGYGSYFLSLPAILGRDLNKAEEFLMKAKEIDPLFPDVYVRLAQIYKLRGDQRKYEAALDVALKLDPDNELALDEKTGMCLFICPR